MTRIGIIYCENRSLTCAGAQCLHDLFARKGTFAEYTHDSIEIVGFTTCGGCPGNKAKIKAESIIKYGGAEKIHLANCILYRSLIPNPRLSLKEIKNAFAKISTKRFNQDDYNLRVARSIKSGELPPVCYFKEKIKKDIEKLGVEVILGTHSGAWEKFFKKEK